MQNCLRSGMDDMHHPWCHVLIWEPLRCCLMVVFVCVKRLGFSCRLNTAFLHSTCTGSQAECLETLTKANA